MVEESKTCYSLFYYLHSFPGFRANVSALPGLPALPDCAPVPLQPSSCLCSCCSGNSELLPILLPSSLLLYMLSMCLDGSSSFGWQTPMHPSKANCDSFPFMHRACHTSVWNTARPAVGELPIYISETLVDFELH